MRVNKLAWSILSALLCVAGSGVGSVLFASTAEAQLLGRVDLTAEMPCSAEGMPVCADSSVCPDGTACTPVGSGDAMQCIPTGHPGQPYCSLAGSACPSRDGEAAESRATGPAGITLCIYPSDMELWCLTDADVMSGTALVSALLRCYRNPDGVESRFEGGDCDRDGVPNHQDLCCTPIPDMPPALVDPATGCEPGTPSTTVDGDLVCEPLMPGRCEPGDPCENPGHECQCIYNEPTGTGCGVFACLPIEPPDAFCVPTLPGDTRPVDLCPDRGSDLVGTLTQETDAGEVTLCIYEDNLPGCRTSGGSDVLDDLDCFRDAARQPVPYELGDCDRDGVPNGREGRAACICAAQADGCMDGCNAAVGSCPADAGPPEIDAGNPGADAGGPRPDAGTVNYHGGGLGSCAVSPGASRGRGLALIVGLALLGLALRRPARRRGQRRG